MIKSITQKIKTIYKGGRKNILAIEVGIKNYKKPLDKVEELAQERIKTCNDCLHYMHEPNPLLRIEDHRLLEADEMMCNECGCALPYKIRQSIIKCKKWKK